jgi:hypothetical protein
MKRGYADVSAVSLANCTQISYRVSSEFLQENEVHAEVEELDRFHITLFISKSPQIMDCMQDKAPREMPR